MEGLSTFWGHAAVSIYMVFVDDENIAMETNLSYDLRKKYALNHSFQKLN